MNFSISPAYRKLSAEEAEWNDGIRFPRLLNVPTSWRSIVTIISDAFAVIIPTLHVVFIVPESGYPGLLHGMATTVLIGLLYIILMQFYEGQEISRGQLVSLHFSASLRAVITTILLYALFCLIRPSAVIPARSIVIWGVETLLLTLVVRELLWRVFSLNRYRVRALILGAGWAGTEVATAIREYPRCGIIPAGFIDDFVEESPLSDVSVVGTFRQIGDIVARLRPEIAVLAITQHRPEHVIQACHVLNRLGIPVTEMPVIYEHVARRVPVQHIDDTRYLYDTGRDYSQSHYIFDFINRLFNFSAALILLLLASPVMLLAALLIAIDTRGGVFYSQERIGLLGRSFRCIKFRSMYPDSESDGAVWAQEDDPRVTRVGRVMRKLRIDELPQLFNVIKGDMNLVGPRPERPEFVSELAASIPFYNRRHLVKPGITGWAQVCYPYANTVEESLMKLQYDLYYIKYRSFIFELMIVLKTIPVVLGLRGM